MDNLLEKYLLQKSSITKTPIKGTLEITPLCNLNCKMCYIKEASIESVDLFKSIEFWLNLIPDMKAAGTLFITIIGGEPLIFPEIDVLHRSLINNGFYVNYTTNGIMLADKIPEWMLNQKPRYITISIYGASDESYFRVTGNRNGYTQVMKAIHNVIDAHIPLKLNYCAIPENINDLPRILKISNHLQIPIVASPYCFPPDCRGEGKQYQRLSPQMAAKAYWNIQKQVNPDTFLEQMLYYAEGNFNQKTPKHTRHFFCNAGTNSFWINWKGNLTGCGLLDDPFEDLNIMPFHIAWSTISQKIEKILVTEECSYCARREICNVCPAKIKAETGSYEEIPYYICNMTEQIIKEADIFRQDN